MENWRIPWIEEIRGFDVKFWRSIDLGVKNSEVLELSVKYQNLSQISHIVMFKIIKIINTELFGSELGMIVFVFFEILDSPKTRLVMLIWILKQGKQLC